MIRRVNRTAFDGTCISITLGRSQAKCLKISYGDKLEPQTLSNMGSQEIDAMTPGNYSTEDAKVTMEATEYRASILPYLTPGYGNQLMPIVVGFSHPDVGDDSDLLDGARIIGNSAPAETGGKFHEVEFTIKFMQLAMGEKRVTINRLAGTTPATGPTL